MNYDVKVNKSSRFIPHVLAQMAMKTKTGCKLLFSGCRRATKGSSLYGLGNCLEPVFGCSEQLD